MTICSYFVCQKGCNLESTGRTVTAGIPNHGIVRILATRLFPVPEILGLGTTPAFKDSYGRVRWLYG